jgi:hypothetical protein
MAKKIIAGILTVLLAIGVCFAVCSCGDGETNITTSVGGGEDVGFID